MFGMEKKKAIFEFDLESDLKKDPKKRQVLLKEVESKIQALKTLLREGIGMDHFDQYGVLLQGYMALQKTLNRIPVDPKGGS